MDDYLSEKEQWEWLKGQVRENAPAAVLAICVVAAGVFGWRWWQGHQDVGRLQAGDRYMQLVHALEQGNRSQALVVLGELERDYPGSPYTDQAKLLSARMYVDEGQLDRAAEELAAVAEYSKDKDLAQVARLRLARVQIAQGKPESALATLGTQASAGAFAGRYHEVRGDAYYAKGDKAAALTEYRSAQTAATEGTQSALLQLKVADLLGGAPPPAAASAAANTAAPHAPTPAPGK